MAEASEKWRGWIKKIGSVTALGVLLAGTYSEGLLGWDVQRVC